MSLTLDVSQIQAVGPVVPPGPASVNNNGMSPEPSRGLAASVTEESLVPFRRSVSRGSVLISCRDNH